MQKLKKNEKGRRTLRQELSGVNNVRCIGELGKCLSEMNEINRFFFLNF